MQSFRHGVTMYTLKPEKLIRHSSKNAMPDFIPHRLGVGGVFHLTDVIAINALQSQHPP